MKVQYIGLVDGGDEGVKIEKGRKQESMSDAIDKGIQC